MPRREIVRRVPLPHIPDKYFGFGGQRDRLDKIRPHVFPGRLFLPARQNKDDRSDYKQSLQIQMHKCGLTVECSSRATERSRVQSWPDSGSTGKPNCLRLRPARKLFVPLDFTPILNLRTIWTEKPDAAASPAKASTCNLQDLFGARFPPLSAPGR